VLCCDTLVWNVYACFAHVPFVLLIPILLLAAGALGACATPYLHPPPERQVEPALHQAHAVMDDGYRLPLTTWQANNSHAVLLALHGMNDYSQAFASSADYLTGRGITLLAYDQRGFGNTRGQGYWHGTARLVKDARVMTRLLRARYPDQPLYLLGESMGGAVVLAALARQPLDVDGIILVAPAVWSRSSMPWYQRFALWLAAHTVPGKLLTGEGLDIRPSDNVAMLRALGRDPLVIKETRVDVLYGISNLMDRATAVSLAFDDRALILYGRNDDIIPRRPTCQWLQKQPNGPSDNWTALFYDNGYHMLTRDLQADVVLGDIARWITGDSPVSRIDRQAGQEALQELCAG
jgi:alpha-beta hydrolase superfamily lysophospholipase